MFNDLIELIKNIEKEIAREILLGKMSKLYLKFTFIYINN